jgi:hypothetical protein
MATTAPAVALYGVTKRFGRLVAVKTLALERGVGTNYVQGHPNGDNSVHGENPNNSIADESPHEIVVHSCVKPL